MRHWETALITGGSTGIGGALAKELCRRGTKVAICARNQEQLEAAAKEFGAIPIQADMSVPDRARDVVHEAHKALGSLDLVIANAGFGGARPATRLKPEQVVAMMMTNAVGACVTIATAIPYMVEAGRGNLVGISSLAAYIGLPTSATYSASKAALSVFLQSIRVDLFRTGIVVTDVRPGFVETRLTKKNKFPMPFMMPADVAAPKILRAIGNGRRIYAFPWPTWLGTKLLTALPAFIYDRLGSRAKIEKSES
jgi:short-subunit dehydrogenase